MTDAQTILKMIEEADPADTRKMDEIDIRTLCWIEGREWGGWHSETSDMTGSWAIREDGSRRPNSYCNHSSFTRPSRSRDALKAIRPEGWGFYILPTNDSYGLTRLAYYCMAERWEPWITFKTPKSQTEELAELHALIQAIEYERSKP